ncbi:MAG: twin-arginine translocase TatA/TatE family subunit [Candidatus Zixiibacteriota bacterium]
MMLGGIGVQELLLIFLAVLLLFGAKRIPDIAHGLGKGMREFKRAMQETQDELSRSMNEPDKKPPAQSTPPRELEGPGNKPPAGA